jgi:hypothetical protein
MKVVVTGRTISIDEAGPAINEPIDGKGILMNYELRHR